MELLDKINEATKKYIGIQDILCNSNLSSNEISHWTKYFIKCIEKKGNEYSSSCGSTIKVYTECGMDDSCRFVDNKINDKRKKAFCKWCYENGLFVNVCCNGLLEIITPDMICDMKKEGYTINYDGFEIYIKR